MESNLIIQVLGYLGGAAVVLTGASRWLGGIWAARIIRIEQARIDKELAIEKAHLAEQLEVSKAVLLEKTRLAEVRLNAVNQERFSALKENYELLAEVWLDCRWAIQPDELGREKPPEHVRLEKAAKSLDVYFKDFERKKMFLSDASQEAVYDFIYRVWKSLDKLRIFANSSDPLPKRLEELYGDWIHDLSPKMNAARKSIEAEYKALIGVDEHNKALQRTSR
jgi:hypothetical protein